ncbi:MAG: hypothetical protein J0H63_12555 [Rhizobiales bacterium]|nr:hypothetical protein [Hyphomicrobiales bacterium]MBN9010907.1 hypothetical protein [Hyphomicrobiales bacterium]
MKIGITLLALAGLIGLGVESASAASPQYCDSVARQYANGKATGSAATGGFVGAIGGAVLGGILGGNKGAGTGALIGGGTGIVVGGAQWQKFYQQRYDQCMAASYQPPPPPPKGPGFAGPPRGQQCPPIQYAVPQSWYQQCAAKYPNSFKWSGPWAGTYMNFDGCRYACQLP